MAADRRDGPADGRPAAPPEDAGAFERALFERWQDEAQASDEGPSAFADARILRAARAATRAPEAAPVHAPEPARGPHRTQIGRASCRERVSFTV